MSNLMVELHTRECSCRGALWMLPSGAAPQCASPDGDRPSGSVVLSAEHWRALGKPRSIEHHATAVRRASPQLRASLESR